MASWPSTTSAREMKLDVSLAIIVVLAGIMAVWPIVTAV